MSVDTLSLAKELRAADFASPQAEAIAAAIGRSVSETTATKADLGQVVAELRTEIAKLETKLDTKIETVRSSLLFWFIGTQVAIGGIVVALIKLLPTQG